MMVKPASIRGILVVAVILAASCGSADTGTAVTIHNGTDVSMRVLEVGINSGSDIVTELAPSAERKSLWHFSDGSKVTVRASDQSGGLTFCHAYTSQEVRQLNGVITITKGRLDCR